MKKVILLLSLVMSFSLFSAEQNMSVEMKSANFYPWQSSATVCAATTRCPNGMVASCRVYGHSWSSIPTGMYNSCTWRVVPGRFVHCQGYQQVYNPLYRMYMWQWVNIPVRCF